MRRRILLGTAVLVLAASATGGTWLYRQMRASLPVLDGELTVPGLSAPVTIVRDDLGIPVITAQSREDVARATGFLHAQERFFQMDLNRRRSAGELSALVGRRALPVDTRIRRHRFRAEAKQALSLMSPRDRAIIDAYSAGVNSGLQTLGAAPFEYLALGQSPVPWRPEDCLLVVLTMFITLQDADGTYESVLGTMHDVLPEEMFEFLTSPGTEWDAPVVGQKFASPPVPAARVYDLRGRMKRPDVPLAARAPRRTPLEVGNWELGDRHDSAVGSNSWVVSGRLTADGAPLVANDMHLDVRVPNTWYRAQFEWPDAGQPGESHRLVGVTLPGYPSLVVGSNTHVAWGFTNTYADWSDIVELDVDPADPTRYQTPDGWQTFVTHDESIEIAGDDPVHVPVTWTIWGPLLPPDHRGRARAYRWVAHSPSPFAALVTPLEDARSVLDAFEDANGIGAPGQNLVVADREGHIGWTIYGSIPRRRGLDGRLPASWAEGTRGWDGWLNDPEYPRLIDPPEGRIWTANARVVDGEMLAKLGDGGYEVGSRATIVRDRLYARDNFTPADMLDVHAVFLNRWRDLILRTLTPALVSGHADRRQFRDLVEQSWDGTAGPQSVGYRFTRAFRDEVSEVVITFVLSECYAADPSFDHTVLRRREGPVWKLVTEQPMHLLDPQYGSWHDLLVRAVDDVIAREKERGDLAARTWSEFNPSAIRHPLSASIPLFGRWLNMPEAAVPGDLFTVRMHWGPATASERLVVSPGREAQGILQMPTGQSGHPLSPFYANSHPAWVKGTATPLLAGREKHRLTLVSPGEPGGAHPTSRIRP